MRFSKATPMADRRIAVALFLLTFVAYAWFFNGGGWNQNAHFDLARALVERQTLHIDHYGANTGDVSLSDASGQEHMYINKPPGVSFLAAIPYALVYAIESALDVPVDARFWVTLNAWLVTMLTCGVTGALIPVVLFRYGRRAGVSPQVAAGVALTVAFGTGLFPFATLLFAHVPAALLLLLALVWLDERPLLAGVAAGIAGASYYLCIPAAAVLCIGAWSRGGARPALRFVLGGLPFGILLVLYHYVCFGSPFITSVELSTEFTEKGLLFGVFRLPTARALWGLTFSEYRGLFFVSPVLLLALAGGVAMWRRGTVRRDLAVIAAIAAIFLFVVASFNGWHAGGSFGPRYLLPAVALLGIPLLFVPRRVLLLLGIPLALVSFAMHLLATAVDPTLHAGISRPVQAILAEVIAGNTSTNTQSMDERFPHQRYKFGSYESEWASFNVGELLLGLARPVTMVPIALWVLLGSGWVVWRGGDRN